MLPANCCLLLSWQHALKMCQVTVCVMFDVKAVMNPAVSLNPGSTKQCVSLWTD